MPHEPETRRDRHSGDEDGSVPSPHRQARFFDPSQMSKSTGSELGLAPVRRILRAHGGAINVMTTPSRLLHVRSSRAHREERNERIPQLLPQRTRGLTGDLRRWIFALGWPTRICSGRFCGSDVLSLASLTKKHRCSIRRCSRERTLALKQKKLRMTAACAVMRPQES